MTFSLCHLIVVCMSLLVVVAIGGVLYERRRLRGLSELIQRIVCRRSANHADEFPF